MLYPKIRRRLVGAFVVGTLALAAVDRVNASTATFTQPDLDRWLYPFSSTGTNGTRPLASVFGSVGETDFDDRDAQFLVGFNTSTQVPIGLGASNYIITGVRVTAVDSQGGYVYDKTYDNVAAYTTATATDDAGHPIEIHGVGFRNGYTGLTFNSADTSPPAFKEGSPIGVNPGAPAKSVRNAYALSFDGGVAKDVSNNVTNNFESNPWAIGIAGGGLAAGAIVPANTTYTFDPNLSDPNVLAYLQASLNSGTLGLMIDGILAASQENPDGIPQFFNKESGLQNPGIGSYVAPQLQIEYTTVPEPASVGLIGVLGLGLLRRRRRR